MEAPSCPATLPRTGPAAPAPAPDAADDDGWAAAGCSMAMAARCARGGALGAREAGESHGSGGGGEEGEEVGNGGGARA